MSCNWSDIVLPGHGYTLHCKTEYRLQGPGYECLYRAHPNYQGEGAYYDWAMINFEGHRDYPCQILLFYQKDDPVNKEATGKVTSGIHAIINSCIAREGTSSERMKNMQETRLWTRWELESVMGPTLDSLKRPCVLWQSQINV
jgi:hypothetical protein